MQESYRKDPASHPDPESCAGGREDAGEAFDRGTRRPAIELRNLPSGVPTPLCEAEGHTEGGVIGKPPEDPAQSETLCMRGNSLRGKREIPQVPVVDGTADRPEKVTLIFYSCASVFDVSPLLMDQESYRSDKHSATPHCIFPLNTRFSAV
jgi:hypothetical protein